MKTLGLLVLCLLPCAAFGLAKPATGQMTVADLKIMCDAPDEPIPEAACRFYILGVYEGMSIGVGIAKDTKHFCPVEGMTAEYMVKLVRVDMAGDLVLFPKDKEMPAVSFISASFMRHYPCS